MAIDTNPISAAAVAVDAALKELFAFADSEIAKAVGQTSAIQDAIAADEASAVAVLGQVADHLNSLAASITDYIASKQPAPAA